MASCWYIHACVYYAYRRQIVRFNFIVSVWRFCIPNSLNCLIKITIPLPPKTRPQQTLLLLLFFSFIAYYIRSFYLTVRVRGMHKKIQVHQNTISYWYQMNTKIKPIQFSLENSIHSLGSNKQANKQMS